MGWIIATSMKLLRSLAEQRRRIIAGWRLLLEMRRLAQVEMSPLPGKTEALKVLKHLLREGDLVKVESVGDVYRAESPYAVIIPAAEEQVLQEANPSAVFSHLTALSHHSLTDQIPTAIYATSYNPPNAGRLPLGTMAEEWSDMPAPILKHPKRVGTTDVHWIRSKGQYDFGHVAAFSQGLPIYVTDPERTLIDAIRSPDLSGGIVNVLRAWKQAKESLNLEKLVAYADRVNEGVLRQRVGFLLTSLGLTHSRFAIWKETLSRGGSSKLLASAPYAPRFSEEWNLSLNVSESVLAELEEE